MDKKLSQIIEMSWELFNKYRYIDNSLIVDPSIPILWFGDLEAYEESPEGERVITFAINPSSDEFRLTKKEEFNFVRFKEGKKIYSKDSFSDSDMKIFKDTLNNYYKDEPYKKWFKWLESPLNCVNASYGGKLKNGDFSNTAIHIDLCPLATSLKWGDVPKNIQKALIMDSEIILSNLIDYLKPNKILASMAQKKLENVFGKATIEKKLKKDYSDGKGGFIKKYDYNGIDLIVGKNMRGTPFGGMAKEFIEDSIKKCLDDDKDECKDNEK